MVRFLIYLFESGLCLTVMYLVYQFFLKRETYFGFNRMYLNAVVLVILLIPLLHISISVPNTERLESPVSQIFKFRNYYEQVIALTDPEYGAQYRERLAVDRDIEGLAAAGVEGTGMSAGTVSTGEAGRFDAGGPDGERGWHALHLSDVLLILYLLGASFFMIRFLMLVYWLARLARKYGVKSVHGVRLISFSEDISPFSFFRFVFMNRESVTTGDYRMILAHEQVHIRQRHSLDLMVAQGITVIQWFNPFAWLIRDAIKSTHEYIADDRVVRQGFGLHDYQSLLLKQLITSRPVELVNNFNLKPIKTRIAMMTRIRSGFPAKLKALVVIPFAFALFLLFADMSFRGPENTVFNFSSYLVERTREGDLDGLWKSGDKTSRGSLIHFEKGKINVLEKGAEVLVLSCTISDDFLVLSRSDRPGDPGIRLKYRLDGDDLSIWWSNTDVSRYTRTGFGNSMEMTLDQMDMEISLPELSHYRILDRQDLIYQICLGYKQGGRDKDPVLMFAGSEINAEELGDHLEKERNSRNKLDLPNLTAFLFIDREVPMKYVHEVKHELRQNNALKFASAGWPVDQSVSPVLLHTVGMPRLLPPMDAKLLDKEEVSRHGLSIFEINLPARNLAPAEVAQSLHDFLGEKDRYIIELVYDDRVPYGQYIESVDMVFKVVTDYRNKLAMEKYNARYEELTAAMQKEIRSVYPVTLTERNADE